MPQEITARLSDEISQPELSKMWESERMTFTTGTGDGIDTWLEAPEMVIAARGKEVVVSFPPSPQPPDKMKAAFERAVHRYRPDVRIDWAA